METKYLVVQYDYTGEWRLQAEMTGKVACYWGPFDTEEAATTWAKANLDDRPNKVIIMNQVR